MSHTEFKVVVYKDAVVISLGNTRLSDSDAYVEIFRDSGYPTATTTANRELGYKMMQQFQWLLGRDMVKWMEAEHNKVTFYTDRVRAITDDLMPILSQLNRLVTDSELANSMFPMPQPWLSNKFVGNMTP